MKPEKDQYHLELLSIFHFLVAGLVLLCSLLPLLWFGIGVALQLGMLGNAEGMRKPQPEEGPILLAFGGVLTILVWSLATVMVLTGLRLAKRKRYDFCLLIARIECLFIPFGTILGICTIQVLFRESVKQSFESPASGPSPTQR